MEPRPPLMTVHRKALEERIRMKHAAERPVTVGQYVSEKFDVAVEQLNDDAAGLTDADIEQLEIVSSDLANRARADRAGVPAESWGKKFPGAPVEFTSFLDWFQLHFLPKNATTRYRAREAHARVDLLETRVNWLEAQLAEAKQAALEEVKQVLAEVKQALAAFPTYKGIWDPSRQYKVGNTVTWSGSMWHADVPSRGVKPGEGVSGWTLSVKRGRDGRDGKDAR